MMMAETPERWGAKPPMLRVWTCWPVGSDGTPVELGAFHRVKAAFDLAGVLNPGRAVAEYDRMDVHGGGLKFSDLGCF